MADFKDDEFIASAFHVVPPPLPETARANATDPPVARSQPVVPPTVPVQQDVAEPSEAAAEQDRAPDELRLAPPVGKSAVELGAGIDVHSRVVQTDFADDEPDALVPQFSLRQLMGVVFAAAVGFGILRLVRADVFAGFLGLLSIAGLAILTIFKPQKAFFYLAWWTLLAMYVISSVFAVLKV